MTPLPNEFASVLWEVLRSPVVAAIPHHGYSSSACWRVVTEDGRSFFLKTAVDQQTTDWLLTERMIYESVRSPHLPKLEAAADSPPYLLLEDLSRAVWPPPWTEDQVSSVLAGLDELHGHVPPPGTVPLEERRYHGGGWSEVLADPVPFLRLRCCSEPWFTSYGEKLAQLEQKAPRNGQALVHLDVRSDNLCFMPDRGVVFFDWSWASRGNAAIDLAAWVPSLHAEGGGPLSRFAAVPPELVALTSGYWASRATRPAPTSGSTVRSLQATQVKSALLWIALLLGLPPPLP